MQVLRTTCSLPVLLATLLAALFAPPGAGQTPPETVCQLHGTGLAFSMKTFRDLATPRAVALEQTGLAKGGPRYRIADAAYGQLEAGVALDEVSRRAKQLCLQIGADEVEDDEPTFETRRGDGGGAQLCADLASSMSAFVIEEPGVASMPLDQALARFRSDDPREQAAPRERAALEIALQLARQRQGAMQIAAALHAHCEKLTPEARQQLDREFYVTE